MRFNDDGEELKERGRASWDCSPDNPAVLMCDGHCCHISLPFLLQCKEAGLILIWRPQGMLHVTQGEDVDNLNSLKGDSDRAIQTLHASRQKYFLQPPYDNILAWGDCQVDKNISWLGASDVMLLNHHDCSLGAAEDTFLELQVPACMHG